MNEGPRDDRPGLTDAMAPHDAYIASAVQFACLLEATAPKPGNVSPGRHFSDSRYEDFMASAAAIGPVLAGARGATLGVTIRRAVDATAMWVRSNTNLGIILLLAPLAAAARAVRSAANASPADPIRPSELRDALRDLLDRTSVDDARQVYAAIRRARPGGLGRVDAQDVSEEPTVTLLEAMRLASDHDGIAREYATAFAVTFERAAPWLERALDEGLSWDDAVVETFLRLLASMPDSHIARRSGRDEAARVSRLASEVLQSGGVRTSAGRRTIDEMERALRGTSNASNPGTTADLTSAAIFVLLLGGAWQRRSCMPLAARRGQEDP